MGLGVAITWRSDGATLACPVPLPRSPREDPQRRTRLAVEGVASPAALRALNPVFAPTVRARNDETLRRLADEAKASCEHDPRRVEHAPGQRECPRLRLA